MYIFDYVPSFQEWIYGDNTPCDKLVCHQTDVPFIFFPLRAPHPSGVHLPNLTKGEQDLGHFIGQVWGNFARSGDPNPVANMTYPRYTPLAPAFANYSVPVSASPGYRNKQCQFWASLGYNRFG
jgi:carboxylesterase type B